MGNERMNSQTMFQNLCATVALLSFNWEILTSSVETLTPAQ